MRILFVEDNSGFAGDLKPILLEIDHVTEVKLVQNKQEAIAELEGDVFDLMVLDLSIPPNSGSDDADPEHGQALFHEARMLHPGTPIFILTGSQVDKFSRGLARFGNQVKLWGDSTPVETVSFFLKEEVTELIDRIKSMSLSVSKMNAVAINTRGRDLGLSPVQTRMLKSYANSLDCVACDVSLLSGGLSDAKVVKATAIDKNRRTQAMCAAKMGKLKTIMSEQEAYEKHVRKLGIGACPNLFSVIGEGVGHNGSIFYTLTDTDTLSLFDRLAADSSIGQKVVEHVRNALSRWTEASAAEIVTIKDVRSRVLSDDQALELDRNFNLGDLRDIENVRIQASISCIHGDLHCGNVLVKGTGEAVIIDFGDAGEGFTALDPIALELSLIFHPDAKKTGLRNHFLEHLDDWPDVDKFSSNGSFKTMIVSCRDWAYDVAGGDLSVLASAYAYILRQLKYDTVPHEITQKLLVKVVERIRAN